MEKIVFDLQGPAGQVYELIREVAVSDVLSSYESFNSFSNVRDARLDEISCCFYRVVCDDIRFFCDLSQLNDEFQEKVEYNIGIQKLQCHEGGVV